MCSESPRFGLQRGPRARETAGNDKIIIGARREGNQASVTATRDRKLGVGMDEALSQVEPWQAEVAPNDDRHGGGRASNCFVHEIKRSAPTANNTTRRGNLDTELRELQHTRGAPGSKFGGVGGKGRKTLRPDYCSATREPSFVGCTSETPP
jgi:hypothetical protein